MRLFRTGFFRILLLTLVVPFLGLQCETNKDYCTTTGTFDNMLGQDGCEWVINLPSGEVLEPLNLGEWGVTPIPGTVMVFEYQSSPSMGGCNIAIPIQIMCVESVK